MHFLAYVPRNCSIDHQGAMLLPAMLHAHQPIQHTCINNTTLQKHRASQFSFAFGAWDTGAAHNPAATLSADTAAVFLFEHCFWPTRSQDRARYTHTQRNMPAGRRRSEPARSCMRECAPDVQSRPRRAEGLPRKAERCSMCEDTYQPVRVFTHGAAFRLPAALLQVPWAGVCLWGRPGLPLGGELQAYVMHPLQGSW